MEISGGMGDRGDVLGAMDTMYQCGKNHSGSLPLIGVNTFLPKEHAGGTVTTIAGAVRVGGECRRNM